MQRIPEMNLTRRSVIQGLGALALAPLIPTIASVEEHAVQPTPRNPHGDTLEDFVGPRWTTTDVQKRLDYESLARKCLQVRVGDPAVAVGSLEGVPKPITLSHMMSHSELNPWSTDDINAACERFLQKEEQIFDQLLQKAFVLSDTFVLQSDPVPDLIARVRDRIEFKRIPVDKVLVCEEDLEVLEERWWSSRGGYNRVSHPLLREVGFRGSLFGMSVITRKNSPILKRNEAIMLTAPEYLGVFHDRGWDVGVGHSIEETWTNQYQVVLNTWGAYRVVFQNL